MVDDDDIAEFEPTNSLLLSSLRFWEVERDLIEERVAAIGRRPLLCEKPTSNGSSKSNPKFRIETSGHSSPAV
jgi:hypothetical protein